MKFGPALALTSLAFVLLLLVACGASPTASPLVTATNVPTPTAVSASTSVPPTVQPYEIVRDIPYQTGGSDMMAQELSKLDLYLPKDRSNFPVLVWFHGGALKYGDKNDSWARGAARRLASEGIGVILPSYRLSPRVKYPTYIEDAASAVAWVYQNISNYHGDPKKLFVGGHSSGAFLAAMVAMDERYLKQHQLSSKQIAGVIPLSGEMFGDSTVWYERGILKTDAMKNNAIVIDETTPMFYVRRDAPPFLSMCAEHSEDPSTVCEENQKFIEALREAGNSDVSFEKILGRDHFSISEMRAPDDPVVKLILAFIQKAIARQ